MSSFTQLPVELLTELLAYMSESEIVACARTNQQVAVALASVTYRRRWRVAYAVYLCAKYAMGRHVHPILCRHPFLAYLSRACRGCGGRTQRKVAGVPLCCRCTRNRRNWCWMVRASVAHQLGVYDVYRHAGARTELVFANDLQALTGMTRRQLLLCLGHAAPTPVHEI